MNGFRATAWRTYGPTHGRESLGLQRLRRETKKLANSNERIAKKGEKPQFLGILGQNGHFWRVFGQNGQNGNFFQKAFGTFFSLLKALIKCKVSEKSNERFSSNSVTYARTDARTHGRTWILRSPTTSSRDQKLIGQKWFQLHFKLFSEKLYPFRPFWPKTVHN